MRDGVVVAVENGGDDDDLGGGYGRKGGRILGGGARIVRGRDEGDMCPSKVLSIRESHNLRESNSQKGKCIEGNLLVLLVAIQLGR
ncbi:hypothetical protein Tco_0839582 [Tanacetum coccineum]|uniref:Uncharacterized protein n=1 Tax=Tanacetum coccineum TaxID=301880 RepID=A0ABQ5AR05_9ASTR